jgi:hypothetical protein
MKYVVRLFALVAVLSVVFADAQTAVRRRGNEHLTVGLQRRAWRLIVCLLAGGSLPCSECYCSALAV